MRSCETARQVKNMRQPIFDRRRDFGKWLPTSDRHPVAGFDADYAASPGIWSAMDASLRNGHP
jgi:hypothetical protein